MDQGSTVYLDDLRHRDKRWRDHLDADPGLAARLASGETRVEYKLVHARVSGSVKVVDLELDLRDLDLTDLARRGVPAGR